MSTKINHKRISFTDVEASHIPETGRVYGMSIISGEGPEIGADWLSNEEALELRDWITANIPDPKGGTKP